MQHRILQPGPLHHDDGTLSAPGWATAPLLAYDRTRVRAAAFRIKEWDYYCVLADGFGIACTVADNGYLGFGAVTLFDFEKAQETTRSVIIPFPLGALEMPASSRSGNVHFQHKQLHLSFLKEPGQRILRIDCPNFSNGQALSGELKLAERAELDSMVIATPFSNAPRAFYYNQKINCLPASGSVRFSDRQFDFHPDSSFGVLDWGRGVWTYSNTWYWGSGSGLVSGVPFGFNIGYGFGDTTQATENMLFYDGKAHKLEHVSFHIPKESFTKPWQFTSSDSRFEMDFAPILDRHSNDNFLVIKSTQHQVFGRFTGKAVLDDGRVIRLKDFLGFAEKVENRW